MDVVIEGLGLGIVDLLLDVGRLEHARYPLERLNDELLEAKHPFLPRKALYPPRRVPVCIIERSDGIGI